MDLNHQFNKRLVSVFRLQKSRSRKEDESYSVYQNICTILYCFFSKILRRRPFWHFFIPSYIALLSIISSSSKLSALLKFYCILSNYKSISEGLLFCCKRTILLLLTDCSLSTISVFFLGSLYSSIKLVGENGAISS